MSLTRSFEVLKMNLGFDYNNFVVTKIVHGLFRFKKVFFVFFNLIAIVDKREMTFI